MAKSNAAVKKFLTLSELEEQGDRDPIYALNTSEPIGGLRSRVIIPIPKSGMTNQLDTLSIPGTHIPIELTAQSTRKSILESSEFRRSINRGLIKLVHRDYAEKILQSEEGREEQERLRREEAMASASGAAQHLQNNSLPGRETSGTPVKPSIMLILQGAEGKTEIQVQNSLKSVVNKTESDLEYIIAEATAMGFQKIKQKYQRVYDRRQAAKSGAGSDDDED